MTTSCSWPPSLNIGHPEDRQQTWLLKGRKRRYGRVVKIQELPYKVMGSCFSTHKSVIADAVASHVIIRDHSEKQAVLLRLLVAVLFVDFPLWQVPTVLTLLIVKVGACHVPWWSSFEKQNLVEIQIWRFSCWGVAEVITFMTYRIA